MLLACVTTTNAAPSPLMVKPDAHPSASDITVRSPRVATLLATRACMSLNSSGLGLDLGQRAQSSAHTLGTSST